MTRQLHLGKGFALPVDVMTSKTAILAQSGAGKTNAGVVVVEELLRQGQQVVVLDPKGDWYGLRSSADGKEAGFPVVVLGGLHADMPLLPDVEAARFAAQLVVGEGISAVVDVSDFPSDAKRHLFTTEFALEFYRLKQRDKGPVLFVIEEADESVPQQLAEATEARMVGAIKRIAKQGRFCGIGVLLISQRPADVNKKVLSQTEILIAMRTWHKLDVKAIESYLKDQVDEDVAKDILATIPGFETGDAYVLSPRFKIREKVHFRMRETFDAGETPKVGAKRREAKVLAPIDLARFEAKMRLVVERAKEEDPKALKVEVAKLRQELARRPTSAPAPPPTKIVQVPVLTKEERRLLEVMAERADQDKHRLDAEAVMLRERWQEVDQIAGRLRAVLQAPARPPPVPSRPPDAARMARPPARHAPDRASQNGHGDVDVKPVHQRLLDGLAYWEALGQLQPSREMVAAAAGYSAKSSGFEKALSHLGARDLVHYPSGGLVELTDPGRGLARREGTPSSADLQDRVLRILKPVHRRLLEPLIKVWPKTLTREELAQEAGYSAKSSGFEKALSRLSAFRFVEYPAGGAVRARDWLFPEVRA